MSEKHPISPSKATPPPKRPNSAQGNPITTRRATAIVESDIRRFDSLMLRPIAAFDDRRLPTNGEVLQRLFYIKDKDSSFNCPTRALIDKILPEIQFIYSKVPCEMQRKDNCIRVITRLYDKWQRLSKNVGQKCLSQSSIDDFKDELSKLCDLTAKAALDQIAVDRGRTPKQREEDIKFIQNQKQGDRSFTMEPTIDKSFAKRQERKTARSTALEKRLQKSTLQGKKIMLLLLDKD